jgi:hypothetical protein
MSELTEPHVLGLSGDGTTWHPLYLPEHLQPVPWMTGRP